MEQQKLSEEARQARLQEMPSPAPAPAVVHAEPIDDWTHKPFFTTTVHAGEHEFSLSRNEDADLVVRVFNTNSGDRFERVVAGDEGITQLVPSDMPAGAKSPEGFAEFLQLAMEHEAGDADAPEAAQITCESREERDHFTVELALTTGAGIFANRYPVNLQLPLKNRATSNDKHLIALRTLSEKFSRQVEAKEFELRSEIAGLQRQLDLMKLQMNQRVFFGVNHSVHIDVEKLMMRKQRVDSSVTGATTSKWMVSSGHTVNQGQATGYADHGSTKQSMQNVASALWATDTEHIMPLPAPMLEPLQLCTKLVSFTVPEEHGMLITDLKFLRGLPRLETLTLHGPKIRDFDQLATLPSLTALTITALALDGGGEVDVTPLVAITTLQSIDFTDSPAVANVAPLAKIQTLQTLNVTGTRVTDRRALTACEGLKVVPE